MNTIVFCKVSEKDIIKFFLKHDNKIYYLFSQNYRKSAHLHFKHGVALEDTMDFCKAHGDQAIIHTMDKIPVYIKYIEKEYQISVYNKTKQKNLLRDKKRPAKAYDSDWNQYVFADVI